MDTTLLRALDKDGREEFQYAMAALLLAEPSPPGKWTVSGTNNEAG